MASVSHYTHTQKYTDCLRSQSVTRVMSRTFVISPTGFLFDEPSWASLNLRCDETLPLELDTPVPRTRRLKRRAACFDTLDGTLRPRKRRRTTPTLTLTDLYVDQAVPCSELLTLAKKSPHLSLKALINKINMGELGTTNATTSGDVPSEVSFTLSDESQTGVGDTRHQWVDFLV